METALALSLVSVAGKRDLDLRRVCSAPKGGASLEEKLTSSRYSPEIFALYNRIWGLPDSQGKN